MLSGFHVPNELWSLILNNCLETDAKVLLKYACISKFFSRIVTDVLHEVYNNPVSRQQWINSRTLKDSVVMKLTRITDLNLAQNFGDIPVSNKGISGLTSLTRLTLGFNLHISDGGLLNLTNLTYLNLSCNRMITDNGITHLTKLKCLDLSGNRIISLDAQRHFVLQKTKVITM
jgi:Leucine-rich repeat (LRR) protein